MCEENVKAALSETSLFTWLEVNYLWLRRNYFTVPFTLIGAQIAEWLPDLDQAIKKPLNRSYQFDLIGRRDWIRTNDPHHVKVVL